MPQHQTPHPALLILLLLSLLLRLLLLLHTALVLLRRCFPRPHASQ